MLNNVSLSLAIARVLDGVDVGKWRLVQPL
jgi:hypothetical protein